MSHKHKASHECTCKDSDEPDEKCPIHGGGEYPPKCEICGQFFSDDEDE